MFRWKHKRFYATWQPTCPLFWESAIWKKACFQHRVAIRLQIYPSAVRDEYAGDSADQACDSCNLFSVPGA
jgi:hypothetical protein